MCPHLGIRPSAEEGIARSFLGRKRVAAPVRVPLIREQGSRAFALHGRLGGGADAYERKVLAGVADRVSVYLPEAVFLERQADHRDVRRIRSRELPEAADAVEQILEAVAGKLLGVCPLWRR